MLEVTRNMTESAKRQAKNGLASAEFLPPDLVQSKRDSDKFYEDLTVRDQKAFLMTVVVTVFADDMEDLDKYTKMVQNNADKHLCSLARLTAQQERGACIFPSPWYEPRMGRQADEFGKRGTIYPV